MKINQYCSVCKNHLDMDVIPTDDGGDDGVIWLRCPQCRGFLPKFSGENLPRPPADVTAAVDPVEAETDDQPKVDEAAAPTPAAAAESLADYASALAAADVSRARPYRPTDTYQPGEVIHHLAWDDCGLVIEKEALRGSRRAIKVYFGTVGVVHLIEQSAGGL